MCRRLENYEFKMSCIEGVQPFADCDLVNCKINYKLDDKK